MMQLSSLNLIIKYYAYNIQQRIEQLQNMSYINQLLEEDDLQYQVLSLLNKNHNYSTNDQKQIKLAKKLIERIIQIYQYFKNKSNSQNLLTLIQNKITQELDIIIKQTPLQVGNLFRFIYSITKRGYLIKVPAQKRRLFSRHNIKQNVKTQTKDINKIDNKIQNKSYHVFNNFQRKNINTANTKIRSSPPLPIDRSKLDQAINGIWNCLDLDRLSLFRLRQTSQQAQKQSLRRNARINGVMKSFSNKYKRIGTQTSILDLQDRVLTQKVNNTRIWTNKKKRIVTGKKRATLSKQNMSIII